MDSRSCPWLGALLAGMVLVLGGCQSALTPINPKVEIPDWSMYRNASIGFYFQYPPILELEERDHDLEGTEVSIVYPGMGSLVFGVDVQLASAEEALLAKQIPGTEESCRVGREWGMRFEIAGTSGTTERRTLVKKDGWIFVFQGTGKTFEEILAGFRFGTPPPLPEEKDRQRLIR